MSHLPLDARAILQHLNELGYRNITAEQLREFLKGKFRLCLSPFILPPSLPCPNVRVCVCVRMFWYLSFIFFTVSTFRLNFKRFVTIFIYFILFFFCCYLFPVPAANERTCKAQEREASYSRNTVQWNKEKQKRVLLGNNVNNTHETDWEIIRWRGRYFNYIWLYWAGTTVVAAAATHTLYTHTTYYMGGKIIEQSAKPATQENKNKQQLYVSRAHF